MADARDETASPPGVPAGLGAAAAGPLQLLLVEDNPADAELTEERLSRVPGFRFDLRHVDTLEGARHQVRARRYDVVLLDLNLPDSRGIETLARLREVAPRIPVVVLTGVVDQALRTRILAEGAQDVIGKNEPPWLLLSRSVAYAASRLRARERQQRFATLVATIPDAILVVDREDRVLFRNLAASGLIGPGPEAPAAVLAAARGGGPTGEAQVDMPATRERFRLEVRWAEIDWDGADARLLLLRDLRDREARELAEGSLSQFREVLERAPLGVQMYREVPGRPPGDFELEWEDSFAAGLPHDPPGLLDAIRRTAAEDSGRTLPDMEASGPDGRPRTIAVRAAPLGVGLVGVFYEDVSERVALAEQVWQAQKLESIGRLAGGIAHDFNNLLTVILGCATEARDRIEAESSLATDLDQIIETALRGTELTRQLLAFGRKQRLDMRVIDLGERIAGLSGMVQRLIGEDVRLEIHRPRERVAIRMDPVRLDQVVLNLVTNARDAMPHGGRVTITVGIGEGPRGTRGATLDIRDTGSGMDEATRSKLFEPFFTTKPEGRGTGLGLASVYGLLTQAGASIDVESEVGRGTNFRLCFPETRLAPEPVPSVPPRGTGEPGQARGEMILLVEDDDGLRTLGVRALGRAGYRVVAAARPDEALELAAERVHEIDLVVTDVIMPGMRGPELVAQLQEMRSGLPALFVSGYTRTAIASDRDLPEGAEFLPKPYLPRELAARIREILDRAGG